ncbi:hypothetical protein BC828DRAFT_400507 [Blastocladiella britannica]|nr:hypothetical protein BC828DRAFT_400507 [Blastocladiella britannica]
MMAFLPEAKDTALLIHSWFQETFYPTTAPSAPAAALAPLTRSLVAKHQPVVQVTAAAPVEPVAAILPTIRTTATAAPTAKLAATTNITASTKPAAAAEPAPTTRTAGGTKFTLGGDMLDGLVAAVTGDESLDALVTRATSPIRGRSPVSAVRSPMTPTPARPLVAVVAPAVTITTSAAAAGAPVVVVAAPAVGAVAAAANDDSATANDDDQYLESRDNARVAQNMLLTRRTMQMSQGLFGESQQADKAFRQRVTAGSPASGVASSSSSGSSSKKTSSKKATKSRPTAAPAAAAASSEPDVE